jgi:unsaturated chondroitin disaccharide hydrolase
MRPEISFILLHGTGHKPAGAYDSGLVWGDYYFLEALLRYQRPSSGR